MFCHLIIIFISCIHLTAETRGHTRWWRKNYRRSRFACWGIFLQNMAYLSIFYLISKSSFHPKMLKSFLRLFGWIYFSCMEILFWRKKDGFLIWVTILKVWNKKTRLCAGKPMKPKMTSPSTHKNSSCNTFFSDKWFDYIVAIWSTIWRIDTSSSILVFLSCDTNNWMVVSNVDDGTKRICWRC